MKAVPEPPDVPSPPLPRSIAAAIERLLAVLEPRELAAVAGTTESDLIGLHFGLGLRIRMPSGCGTGPTCPCCWTARG